MEIKILRNAVNHEIWNTKDPEYSIKQMITTAVIMSTSDHRITGYEVINCLVIPDEFK